MKPITDYILREIKGDTLTPIAILQMISGQKKFLLESSHKYSESGRYSFIGSDPAFEFLSTGDSCEVRKANGENSRMTGKPLEILKGLLPFGNFQKLSIPFTTGAIGYIGYDVIRQYEQIGEVLPDEVQMPEIHLMIYNEVVIFDHLEEKVFVLAAPRENEAEAQLEVRVMKRIEELKQPVPHQDLEEVSFAKFEAETTKEEFVDHVKKAKEHIISGDIFQVVISQRMKASYTGSPLTIYRKHRANNPTPYMFYIDFEHYTVIGSSPESLVKTRERTIIANPIAGTRRRGKTIEEDVRLEHELQNDEKELAEHKMLVDLSRNDLGRVCQFGSVKVDKFKEVEKFRHVMHLVSEVSGELKEKKTALDALAACLPAGTVSGAPKIRAMEIINLLEKTKRGLYSGAIGYLSANGDMDFALAIRTMILKKDTAYIQAGAGIVYDSEPESEYEETLNKLRSFLEGGQ